MNAEYTQRIGLVDDDDEVYAWMCPFCKSEFNLDGGIIMIHGNGNTRGDA